MKRPIKTPLVLGKVQAARIMEVQNGEFRPTWELLKSRLPDWRVRRGPDGEPIKDRPHNTVANVKALADVAGWGLRYNVMTKRTELTKPGLLAPRDDHDNAALAYFGDTAIRAGMARDGLAELVDAAGGGSPYHPVLEWIEATPWDGRSRLPEFHASLVLPDQAKASLRDTLMDAWALQAIGALLEANGIAAQGVLVLNGHQEVNKTRWANSLCPFFDAVRIGLHIDPLDKDSVLQATGAWISEAGELDSTMRRSDVSALKAFFTRDTDVVRPAYARRDNTYRRRTVFVGSVNGTGFLVDDTGNRRYWVIEVVLCQMLAPEFIQQVWAEYLALYRGGKRWHLDAETKAGLNASNIDHAAVDPLRERIATRFDWATVEWDTIDPDNWRAFPKVAWKSATDVCVLAGIERPTRAEATRVGAIVRDLQRVSGRVSRGTLERKSNGTKLLAVPAVRAAGV